MVINRSAIRAARKVRIESACSSGGLVGGELAVDRAKATAVDIDCSSISVAAGAVLGISISAYVLAMHKRQINRSKTHIAPNIEKPDLIASADCHGLSGSIQDGVGRNVDGICQHNHAAAGKGHIAPAS